MQQSRSVIVAGGAAGIGGRRTGWTREVRASANSPHMCEFTESIV
jgi:hypothetical protein